jgi:hypothetical protein
VSGALRGPHHHSAPQRYQGDPKEKWGGGREGDFRLKRPGENGAQDDRQRNGEQTVDDPGQDDQGYPDAGGRKLAQEARPDGGHRSLTVKVSDWWRGRSD